MSDFMRLQLITEEWQFEEWDIDSLPNISLYPLQQGKVDKTRTLSRDYREQGEEDNDKRKNNNDCR